MTKYSLSIFSNLWNWQEYTLKMTQDDISIISISKKRSHLKLEVWNPGCESVWSFYWQSVVYHLAQTIVRIVLVLENLIWNGGFGICNLEDVIWNMWSGITALGGIMWEPSILLINGSWKLNSIFSIHIFLSPPNFICTQEDSTMDIGGAPSSNWSALKTWDETCKTWFPCHFGLLLLLLLCMLHQANGHGLGVKFCWNECSS